MKKNEWIKFEDIMPPINKTIEVKEGGIFSCRTVKARLFNEGCNFVFYLINEKDGFEKEKITHPMYWRDISEKRPDFSKIKKGDLISVQSIHEYTGYLSHVYNEFIRINQESNLMGLEVDIKIQKIKKITRINLEEKTFEEI